MPCRRPPFRLARHPDQEFDYTLFHAVPGAWRSVDELRASLSNREWIEHAAYLRRKREAEDKAMKQAGRRNVGGAGRGR